MTKTASRSPGRRAFLRGMGGSAALRWFLRSAEARAAEGARPLRLLVIHRPNGTIPNDWASRESAADFTLGRIAAPFDPLKPHLVVADGLDIVARDARTGKGGNPSHELGSVGLFTGCPAVQAAAETDWVSTAPSFDQLLAGLSAPLRTTPFRSLQLAADGRTDGWTACRAISYSGPKARMLPELDPRLAYARLFGSLLPGQGGESSVEMLGRARREQRSVLDFIRKDLRRLSDLVPSEERPQLEAHAAAVRDLESTFDQVARATSGRGCSTGAIPREVRPNSDADHEATGKLQLATIRAAFSCDLVRVVTFMWAASASQVVWKDLFPGMPRSMHHSLSHESLEKPNVAATLSAIDRWYAARTSDFIRTLEQTPDVAGGSILDNTLIVYVSEVSVGLSHSYANVPILLFGGAGGRMRGGRLLRFGGRPTNDLWLAIAPLFGVELGALGTAEQHRGPLPGLFS